MGKRKTKAPVTFGVASGQHQGEWAVWLARFRAGDRIGVNILTPDQALELARNLTSHAAQMRNKVATQPD